jgi:hypothetical protein
VEEEIINRFPIQFAKTTQINHDDLSSPKIIQSKNFSKDADQTKKATLEGALVCQILLQGKGGLSLYAMIL